MTADCFTELRRSGKLIPLIDKRAPETMDEALDMIDDLRARLAAALGQDGAFNGAPDCLTSHERAIYAILASGRLIRYDTIFVALYGLSNDPPDFKILKVWISRIRKKLPPGEHVVTVWGEGYRLVRECAA